MAAPGLLEFFRKSYATLTGNPEPFPWQEDLFFRFCQSDIPTDVVIPTGCGKTGAMISWLVALAHQARHGPEKITLPRRLVWVVNRRVIVDQATNEAEKIRKRVSDKSCEELEPVRQGLKHLCSDGAADLVSVSTLRGQFADNAAWRDDPARAAIVVGTVDMIGSRILFSGYGPGFKSRPLHAGFIGQDALLIHDEAHLEPAFQELITAVAQQQQLCQDFRPLKVLALTATSRVATKNVLTLTEADRIDTEIRRRVEASKGVVFHPIDVGEKVTNEVLRWALGFRDSDQAILIFLRKVDDVQEIAGKLRKQGFRVCELTGTVRGYERDRMIKTDSVFARFTADTEAIPATGSVYLVSTSAGEVGVNMSADHLVCDLTPFDSMIQRFGRVNRFGKGEARIEIIFSNTDGQLPTKTTDSKDASLAQKTSRASRRAV